MPGRTADFTRLLEILSNHDVDFVVVGGVCGVLHGAPVTTFDLDVVHSREPGNLRRLLEALNEMEAHFRGQGRRRIAPDLSHLSSAGHQLLMTAYGPLDLLGSIGDGLDFEKLRKRTVRFSLTKTIKIRVLDLETLIELKRGLGRDKDRAVLAALENTLRLKKK